MVSDIEGWSVLVVMALAALLAVASAVRESGWRRSARRRAGRDA
jgi:hypothetical protein